MWTLDAENDLASVRLSASGREAITRAAYGIDQALRAAPYAMSESRSDRWRIIFRAPLGAVFEVSDDDGLVRVVMVWRY